MESMKEGLIEQMPVKDSDEKMGMKRNNPGQVPHKPASEKASKAGKSFKIQ